MLIAPTSGGAPPQIIVEAAFALQWSPDGKWLVYVHLAGNTYRLAKIRGGSPDPPVYLGRVSEGDGINSRILPEWSPTGEWIACDDHDGRLTLVSPDGKRRWSLGGNGSVAWARDGKALYQLRLAEQAIVAVNVTTGLTRVRRRVGNLLPHATREPAQRLSLTPDGKNIVYSVLHPRKEIWLRQNMSWAHWMPRVGDWFSRF